MSTTPSTAQRTDAEPVEPRSPVIRDGVCHVMYAYDVGLSIDLGECDQRITLSKQRERVRHKRRAPRKYFESQSPPLRVTQETAAIDLGVAKSLPAVDLVIHDFGVATVVFSFVLQGPLSGLLDLSDRLYDNDQLREASRRHVERVVDMIRPAVARPRIARVMEDYTIFEIKSLDAPVSLERLYVDQQHTLAKILRSERSELSEQEITDALACRISFGPEDLAIIDWNAAMLFDPQAEDTRAVLELANAELLEMRFLDDQLDDTMEQAYRSLVLQRQDRRWGRAAGGAADIRRIARLQVDHALLFEGVNNALKLLGDQYLARVYRLASQRFHLQEWDGSILRKLQSLESIYQKLTDRSASLRMEVLEWIIIILIAVSIVLPFLPWGSSH